MNLVLDLDGTLIADNSGKNIIPRPYVDEFLDFAFKKFKNVGVWTAASPGWAEEVIDKLFSPVQKRKLSFIWTDDMCDSDIRGYVIKPLKKIWTSPALKKKGFKKENTIILEDTHRNCKKNLGNNIIVKPYRLNYKMANDDSLRRLSLLLDWHFFGGGSKLGGRKKSPLRSVNFLEWGLN